jgi:hypothetical protein
MPCSIPYIFPMNEEIEEKYPQLKKNRFDLIGNLELRE